MIYISVIFITLLGTFLHFLYEISHENKYVAIFAAVNESTWEHIKIGMTPTLLWHLYDLFKYGLNNNFIVALTSSLTVIIILIPLIFYSYTLFTKKAILWVDIISFYITIIISEITFNYLIKLNNIPNYLVIICIIILIIELLMYFFFTYYPLKNKLFEDPITHKYGIDGHSEIHHH